MSQFKNTYQKQIGLEFMGFSKPMIGYHIPGEKVVYAVSVRNHPDLKEDVRHTKKPEHPVVRFPGQGDPHSKNHPMMEKLRSMLSKDPGKMKPQEAGGPGGYSRIKEDLSWRGQGHLANRAHM
jgi:hypothetical protein